MSSIPSLSSSKSSISAVSSLSLSGKTEDVLKLDEKLNVVVLDYNDKDKRISLGMKQLTPISPHIKYPYVVVRILELFSPCII